MDRGEQRGAIGGGASVWITTSVAAHGSWLGKGATYAGVDGAELVGAVREGDDLGRAHECAVVSASMRARGGLRKGRARASHV